MVKSIDQAFKIMMQGHVAMSAVLPELIIVQTRVLRSCDWQKNTKKEGNFVDEL